MFPGWIVKEMSGTPYETYVKTHIYDPAEMSYTGFEPGGAAIGYMEVDSGEPLAITRALTSLLRGPGERREHPAPRFFFTDS